MGRNLEPKSKQERREGVKLFLKGDRGNSPKNSLVKRPYPPGQHGPTAKGGRLSSYGLQLREKQKAKKFYRLLERQFSNYYVQAAASQGETAEVLLQLLERRLDNVCYRLGLAVSRDQARQLVTHGHIFVNGRKLNIPSYQLKIGEEVSVKPAYLKKTFWTNQLPKIAKQEVVGWLSLDAAAPSGKLVSLPKKEELAVPFDPTLIIEFYSR